MDLFQATHVQFACTQARAGLADSSIAWPATGPELLDRYLAAIQETSVHGEKRE
jgi:hypothetical protein